jgi:A/G-specific adenine glycosylase
MTPRRAARQQPRLASGAVTDLRAALLRHYDRTQRRLPWRGETDSYRILVSEVMLQQTRVETVERYYGAWLERFPDFETLAAAEEDAVLKAWEGLGYYRRARNLQRAAQVVRERPGSALPGTYADLRDLPGVGDYTAGAVASIAYGERVPAADGNVRRVLSRLFDVARPKAAWVRAAAADLVDPERPGDWNQALMELGATLCSPRRPACAECPLATWCGARAAGTQAARPGGTRRAAARRTTFALAVLRDGERVLLQRRPPTGLLGGMWALPEREVASGDDGEVEQAVVALAAVLGASPLGHPERLAATEHRFTHLHATYLPCVVPVDGARVRGERLSWIVPGAPTELALPAAQRRVLGDPALRSPVEGGGSRSPEVHDALSDAW